MSITSRINEMSSHIEQAYDELQGLGADLTNVNKNIENISMVLDDIYDSMPQVSGEGTNLTLDDTRVGKIKSTLKGNTSQDGTPTPTSPIPVNVVSGDNEISVVGKNIISVNMFTDGIVPSINSGQDVTVAEYCSTSYIEIDNTLPLYLTINVTSGQRYVLFYDENYNFLGYQQDITSYRISSNQYYQNTKYIRLRLDNRKNNITSIQLEYNSNPTDYEPYQNNVCSINLGVENLWDTSKLQSGYLNQSGSYPTTNPSFPNARYRLVYLYKGQSITTYKSTLYGDFRMRYIDVDTNLIVGTVAVGDNGGYCSSNVSYQGSFNNGTITALKDVILGLFDYGGNLAEATITYGTKIQAISPTPIELCKIGNYQDYFGKSDGRNLFDKDNLTIEIGTISTAGTFDYSTERLRAYYIEVDENTTYTVSTSSSDLQIVPYFYNSSKTFISFNNGWKNFPYTFTTPANTKYLALLFKNSNNTPSVGMIGNLQLEKGSSATPWQPFGVGKWYLHKEIGKLVLDGSESWNKSTSYPGNYYCQNGVPNAITFNVNCFSNLTNIFWNSYTQLSNGDNGIMLEGGGTNKTIDFKISSISTLDDFKSFLGNDNLLLYYILATPTTTEITYQPLIDQLNELEKAMSKDGQTNISQVNNDLPFIISASALKEWQESTSLNSTLSMVNPLSLGNTLNTQDNNIQPIEVDNIEPLEEEENEES